MDYKKLLMASNPFDRLDAWFKTQWILDNNVLSKDELIGLKDKFIELLNNPDETVRLHAWQQTPELISRGILNYEDIKDCKANLIQSLKEGSLEAWLLVNDLYKGKIISKEDITNVVDTFISLLKGNELDRIAIWSLVPDMLKNSLIDKETILNLKKYVLDLLTFNDYDIRFNVLFLIIDLYKAKIFTENEIRQKNNEIKEIVSDPKFNDFLKIYEKDPKELKLIIT